MTMPLQALIGGLGNSRRGRTRPACSVPILMGSESYLSEAVVLCCAFSCDFVAFAAVWCFAGP
jgi:hypothetical protein